MKALVALPVLCVTCAARVDAADVVAAPAPEPRQLRVLLKLPAPHYRPDGGYAAADAAAALRAARRGLAMALARAGASFSF